MGALVLGAFAFVGVGAGLALLILRKDAADALQRGAKYTPAPESIYTSGAAGCAGVLLIIAGLFFAGVAVLVGLTG